MTDDGHFDKDVIIARSRKRRRMSARGKNDDPWLNVMLVVYGLLVAGLVGVLAIAFLF